MLSGREEQWRVQPNHTEPGSRNRSPRDINVCSAVVGHDRRLDLVVPNIYNSETNAARRDCDLAQLGGVRWWSGSFVRAANALASQQYC